MVQLIVGKKGKGKTKQLLDKVNAEVKTANGNIVYIDKSVYLDSFLKVAKLEGEDITDCVEQLEGIGKQYNITFVLSVSMDKEELPEGMQDKIIVAL